MKKFVPDAELVGIDYGDGFDWSLVQPLEVNGLRALRRVYLVDFSLPPADMKRLAESCDLVWIDHHKSAIEACYGPGADVPYILGLRHTEYAACELTWHWFSGREFCLDRSHTAEDIGAWIDKGPEFPEAVRLLGRYDVWDAENPEWPRIEAFQFGLRSVAGAMDPENGLWKDLLGASGDDQAAYELDRAARSGAAILSYRDQEAKALCADGCHEETIHTKDFVPVRADGGAIHPHRLVCLNTLQRGSWLFKGVWDPEKHDAMCVYGKLKDGRWRVSLYSTKPEVDCGAIAKSFGGGGHRGASGFICDELPWRNV